MFISSGTHSSWEAACGDSWVVTGASNGSVGRKGEDREASPQVVVAGRAWLESRVMGWRNGDVRVQHAMTASESQGS